MTIETIDLVDTLAGNSSYFLIFDFLMLFSIHPELQEVSCTFWIRKFSNINKDLIPLPLISTDYVIDFILFLVSPFSVARMWNC